MAYRTRSSSKPSLNLGNFTKSRKAQFFILTAITIATIIYFMSKWMEPYTIIDTSSVVLNEQPFVLNNIAEKADATVAGSADLEELAYNLQEYSGFVSDYATKKGMAGEVDYQILEQSLTGHPTAVVFSCIRMRSPEMTTRNCHAAQK